MFKCVLILAFVLPLAISRSVTVQKKCTLRDGPVAERSLEEQLLFPRALDAKGYRLNIVVLYDDTFAAQFKGGAEAEIKKMVALADASFKDKSLSVKIQLDTLAIEHAKGSKWDGETGADYLDQCSILANKHKITDANNYICLGGKPSGHGAGGVAFKGVVCDLSRQSRVAYTQYVTMSGDTGMDLNAAQMTVHTAAVFAHEIGHNLGMDHDFNGQDSTKLKNNPDGKGQCKGTMDYIDTTDGWSQCSNADIKKFLNGLKKNCLKPIGTTGTSTDWSEGVPEGGPGGAPPMGPDGGWNPADCKLPFCVPLV